MGLFGKIGKALKKADPARMVHKSIQGKFKKKKPMTPAGDVAKPVLRGSGSPGNGVGSRVIRDDAPDTSEEPRKKKFAEGRGSMARAGSKFGGF